MAWVERSQRQRDAVAALRKSNPAVTVLYDDPLNNPLDAGPGATHSVAARAWRAVQTWMRDRIGADYVATVRAIEMLYATDTDLACVARFTGLRRLDLERAIDATDAGLGELAKLTDLRTLSIDDADRITDVGLVQLERLTSLRQLVLGVRAGCVTPAAIARLRGALPRCRVEVRGEHPALEAIAQKPGQTSR
jgi:hypothetical protein